ncbi:MAG: hypothetical protein IPN25_08590 [Sphingobacteriales bacterium]|nr:hypothetical protein [Sphingobacteriales bacterium]
MKHKLLLLFFILTFLTQTTQAQLSVNATHPRLFLDTDTKNKLLDKKTANDPDWLALKTEADNYATLPVSTWNPTTATQWLTGTIFYSYCGSSWEDAALSLGMAHQITKGNTSGSFATTYSNKLLQLADTIIAAYNAYPPCSGCANMFLWNSSYGNRHVGMVVAIIYDWCYDELGTTRKNSLLNLMNNWFNYMRTPFNTYQNQNNSTGNYFFGNITCAAFMGYATMYDSADAQEMIDYARQRILGTQSGSLNASDLSTDWLKQTYTGGLETACSASYLGPANYTTAPQQSGYPVQGWAYGGTTYKRLIDYCFIVTAATGEAIADSMLTYLTNGFTSFTHAITPNRFQVDNSTDWGSFLGSLLGYAQPLRFAAILAGSDAGPNAQYFYEEWVEPVTLSAAWNHGYVSAKWESFLYRDANRPSEAFDFKPFYPNPEEKMPVGVQINKDFPRYYFRNNWSKQSIWAVANMGCSWHDDHQHHSAGHFQIVCGDANDGDDYLLVGANEVGSGGAFGQNGVEGGNSYHDASSHSNTLFINDFQTYLTQSTNGTNMGGQSYYGYDEPTAQEQTDSFSYFRADLVSAYHRKGELADTVNRSLRSFFRNLLYLRNPNLFVVYDQFLARNSNSPMGQFPKHLRWHFMEEPTQNGKSITALMDNSKIHVHTVMPSNISINFVNESNNPDNIWGPGLNYGFNTFTWRAEVSQVGNPLAQTFLTVLQPGGQANPEMTTLAITTNENNMDGTLITTEGRQDIVFFNNKWKKYPSPVTQCSYSFAGGCEARHTLVGVKPNTLYYVAYDGETITVTESVSQGQFVSSEAGVLRFGVFVPPLHGNTEVCNYSPAETYSVIATPGSIYNWKITGAHTVVAGCGLTDNTCTISWTEGGSTGSVGVTQTIE